MPVALPPNVNGFTGLTQQARLCLETNPGEQLLLAQTLGASTMGLTLNPNQAGASTTGMHLHFYVIGNPGVGTIVTSGTQPGGGGLTSQTYHINPAPLNTQGYSEFTTTEVFQTVTASTGIALSAGLLPCSIMVFGSPAGKYLIPVIADAEETITKFSPVDKRGILFKNMRVAQLVKGAVLSKFDISLTADALWALYMLVTNNPTITTLPATPTVLLAATAKAGTMTLTTAPTTPGMFFVFTPAGNSVTGTITINGKDVFGNTFATPEVVTVAANNNVVYSQRRYSSINVTGTDKQFQTSGLSVASTLAVSGVYAWTYTGTWDGITNLAKSSATLELYDGVQGVKLPFTIINDGTFTWDKQKEMMLSCKGSAQDFLIVGDPNPVSVYPSGTNPFAILAQPTATLIPSWSSSFFIDAMPGVPFTTQSGELLTFKAQILTGQKEFYVGDGMQRWSDMTYTTEPDVALDATVVYQSYQEYVTYFKPNARLVFGAVFQGALLGSIVGIGPVFENIAFTFPARIDTFKADRSKSPVEGVLKLFNEYAFDLGFGFRMAMTTQVPPTYVL